MALRLLDQLDYLLGVVQLGVIAERLAHHELLLVLLLHVYRVALLHDVGHLLLLLLLLLAVVSGAVVGVGVVVVGVALEVVDELDLVGGEDLVGLALLCLLVALVRFGNFLDDFLSSIIMLPARALPLLLALITGLGRGDLLLLLLNVLLVLMLLLLSDLLVDDALDLAGCLGVFG